MAAVEWASEESRSMAEAGVRLVLTQSAVPLDKHALVAAASRLTPPISLTTQQVNSIIYSLRYHKLVRQPNKGENPPKWELACRRDGLIRGKEVRRGCFFIPRGPEFPYASCPYEHRMDASDSGTFLICRPDQADSMGQWLQQSGLTVSMLSDQLNELPQVKSTALGDFFLVPYARDWSYYDAAELAWRSPKAIYHNGDRYLILRDGWSLRQHRSTNDMFFQARPGALRPIDGVDEAILRALDPARAPTLPSMEQNGLCLVNVDGRWLPPAWFKWLSTLRPSAKYPERKLVVASRDRPLLEQALARLGLKLGPWHLTPSTPTLDGFDPELHEATCALLGHCEQKASDLEATARGWLDNQDGPAASTLQHWVDHGMLHREQGDEALFGRILHVQSRWRYVHGRLKQHGFSHLLFLPTRTLVVNLTARRVLGGAGEWLGITKWSLWARVGLLRGTATKLPPLPEVGTMALCSDFASERTKLLNYGPAGITGDFAQQFPMTGRPCRVAVIPCQVTGGLSNSGPQPVLRVRDHEGVSLEIQIPWEIYQQQNHPVHRLMPGDELRPLVSLFFEPNLETAQMLLNLEF